MPESLNLYEHSALRRVTGPAIRPGGVAITGRALEHMLLHAGSRVLDVGSGAGATLEYLAGRGLFAVGVDKSPAMLRDAVVSRAATAMAEELPFADHAFDAVFCECALSLTGDPVAALGEMRRVLKPGGMLAVSDLYARGEVDGAAVNGVSTCLANMAGLDECRARIQDAGFEILVEEDQTRKLKELAARIIFEHGGLEHFWASLIGRSGAACMAGRISKAKPGYYLITARRK